MDNIGQIKIKALEDKVGRLTSCLADTLQAVEFLAEQAGDPDFAVPRGRGADLPRPLTEILYELRTRLKSF